MASLSSLSSLFLCLSLVIFIHQPSIFVRSDDALIQQVCAKAVEPIICSDCLHADPQSKTADARGLAAIAIHCAESDATIFYDNIDGYSKNTTDASLKKLLEDCALHVYDARDDFTGVLRNVEAGAYDLAKGVVNDQIHPGVNYCIEQFDKDPKLPKPPTLLDETAMINFLTGGVIGILNYLIG